jgi:hypothetical protein
LAARLRTVIFNLLGRVAEEQGRFEKALEIFVEFNDRHSAAKIFCGLGMVAEAQCHFTEAEDAYMKALKIFVEFNDAPVRIVLRALARLWRSTGAASIPSAVATILKIEIEQATQLLEQLGEGPPDPHSGAPATSFSNGLPASTSLRTIVMLRNLTRRPGTTLAKATAFDQRDRPH